MSVEEDTVNAAIKDLRRRVESLEQWAGNNSQQSHKKQEKTENENLANDQQPAQTTDSHSEKDQMDYSAATSTDGLNANYDV